MKKSALLFSILAVMSMTALAQGPGNPPDDSATATFNVQATVISIFEFELTDTGAINLGNVDTSGSIDAAVQTAYPSLTATPNITTGSAVYALPSAKSWTLRSAPIRDISIEFTSNAATGGMSAGQLELQIPASTLNDPPALSDAPTSTGFLAAGTGNNLLTGMLAGRGALERSGTVDLELTVEADDVAGAQTFEIVLTAYGT
jgi:hypothetical protein